MSIDLYMFAGVNGAGKSTLYSSIAASERPKIKRVGVLMLMKLPVKTTGIGATL